MPSREKVESKAKRATSFPVDAAQTASSKTKASYPVKAKVENSAESLVVFENKKLTAQSGGSQSSPRTAGASEGKVTISAAGAKGSVNANQTLVLSEENAKKYVIGRVEQVFPDEAELKEI